MGSDNVLAMHCGMSLGRHGIYKNRGKKTQKPRGGQGGGGGVQKMSICASRKVFITVLEAARQCCSLLLEVSVNSAPPPHTMPGAYRRR